MLETIDRIEQSVQVPLSAQPNAGRPRDIEGRTIYLSSPEYMASYARRFVAQGVRLVGGCCGTTPEHIRQMKTAIARTAAQRVPVSSMHARSGDASSAVATPAQPPVARRDKSYLAHALSSGRFVTMVETLPPRGHDSDTILNDARLLRIRGVDVLHIAEGTSGPRASALATAVLIQQRTGIETSLQYSCRDRNLL